MTSPLPFPYPVNMPIEIVQDVAKRCGAGQLKPWEQKMKDDKGLTCTQLGEAVAAIVEAKIQKSNQSQLPAFVYNSLTEQDFKEYALPATRELKGVEVCAVGFWKGDHYTHEDLEEIVNNWQELCKNKKVFDTRFKLDHGNQEITDGLPAIGYITNLWKSGKKLFADISKVPNQIHDLIKVGAYKSLSPEIWFNRVFDGKRYRRVMTAISLLGDKLPAMETLNDITKLFYEVDYSLPGNGGELRAYSIDDYKPEENYFAKVNIKASLDALKDLVKAGKIGKLKENQLADPSAIWSGVGGSFTSCVATLEGKDGITDANALCAWLHHEAEGTWPAESSKQTKHTEEDKKMDEKLTKENEDLKAKNAELEKGLEEKNKETESFKAEMAKKDEAVRKEKRDAWLEKYSTGDDLKITPFEKPIAEFLMESLDSNGGTEEVKKLSLEKEELTPLQAFQRLFEKRAGLSGILRELSTSDATHKGEGAIGLDEEVALYMKENVGKTYAEAVDYLRVSKPELFKEYSRPEPE